MDIDLEKFKIDSIDFKQIKQKGLFLSFIDENNNKVETYVSKEFLYKKLILKL